MGQVMNRTSTKPGFRLRGIQSWGKGMITYVCNMFLHIYFSIHYIIYILYLYIYISFYFDLNMHHTWIIQHFTVAVCSRIFFSHPGMEIPKGTLSWWKMARFLLECHVRISNFPWLNQPFVAIFGWSFPKMLVKLSVCWSRKSNSSQYFIFGW